MRHVASVATHIESRVPAALVGNIQALGVAVKTEILSLLTRQWLQQLILIVAGVRIVTLQAISDSRRMNCPF